VAARTDGGEGGGEGRWSVKVGGKASEGEGQRVRHASSRGREERVGGWLGQAREGEGEGLRFRVAKFHNKPEFGFRV